MYFAILLFWVTIIVMVIVSLSTEKIESYRVIAFKKYSNVWKSNQFFFIFHNYTF